MSNIPRIIIDINPGCNTCNKPLTLVPTAGGCGCSYPTIPCNDTTPNSPCADCDDPCEEPILSDCIFYIGADIPALGIKTDDRITRVLIILASEIIALKQRVAALGG